MFVTKLSKSNQNIIYINIKNDLLPKSFHILIPTHNYRFLNYILLKNKSYFFMIFCF